MADLVAGGVVGAAFGDGFAILHETISNVLGQIIMFRSILERLASTLDNIAPIAQKIGELSLTLDLPEKKTNSMIKKMAKGKELVLKCSKVNCLRWDYCFKAYYYSKKLEELNDEIEKFCRVDLMFQITLIGLQTSAKVDLVLRNTQGSNDVKQTPPSRTLSRQGSNDVKKKPPSRTLSRAVSRPLGYIVGLDWPLKELKMELLTNKEEQVLLLTAPGGCGKTTLVQMLSRDEEIRGIYGDNIFYVKVSIHANLKVAVQKIYSSAYEFRNDEEAIDQLERHLKQIASNGSNPILMILDDVCLESESTIYKFKFNIPDYKIVVTSRTAFPNFKSIYNLKPLDYKDAMTLVGHLASFPDVRFYFSKDIEKVVRDCAGLPLALQVIGGSLRGRPVEVWPSILKRWSDDGHSIFESDEEVLPRLERSLSFPVDRRIPATAGHSIFESDEEVLPRLEKCLAFSDEKSILKEYFMDLGSFPVDRRIPATALIDLWTELHEPNQNEVHVTANLHELTRRNLASPVMTRKDVSVVSNYYNEDFVTQHHALRDLAIHLSSQEPIKERERLIVDISGNKLPNWCMKKEQQLINARLLSISTDELFSSSWGNIQAPKVEALVLNFQTRNYTLPEFLENMVELKVIIITNDGLIHAELSNFQLLKSLPNLKRIRLEKVSIPSLCNAPAPLKNVKKISLFMCNIGQALGNSTIQVSDSLPNLMEMNIDYCNDMVELPTWLCEVLSLKKLSITNCHKLSALPEGIRNLVNLEVVRFRSCTELSELPESIRSLHKLRILDIACCLSIIKLPKHIGEFHHLEELYMNKCLKLRKKLPSSITDLNQLKLVVCDEERAKLWEPFQEFLPSLKLMVVKEDINFNWLQK